MEEQIPEILYHYCSVDVFHEIIKNKTLRLSEIEKSNDSLECQWLEQRIVPSLIRKRLTERIADKSNIEHVDNFIKEAVSIYKGFGDSLYNSEVQKMTLAICFSRKGDLLSQWRGYGDDGYGIAIGFDTQAYGKYLNSGPFQVMQLRKVEYNEAKQEKVIYSQVEGYVRQFLKNPRSGMLENSLAAIYLVCLFESTFYKNPAFSEEAEWRLAASLGNIADYLSVSKQYDIAKLKDILTPPKVYIKDEKVIFYSDLAFEHLNIPEGKVLIPKIIIGPKCKLSCRDIIMLLGSYGYDCSKIEVESSTATYV